ncbi:RNA-binding protein 45-like [Sycon ciliatum]|uniref:RNA-binding protein 45-like n=1 Tax=Sycon ciliatum TaxID=27933 RepID=UPI0020AB6221|eukprot:scpid67065/ scgid30920/ RNA-binding protein 45; Developmentally-regulated RNA-binding protein 1; RNA-binding motif protein 45
MGERSGGADMDNPPYSRLFVACGKQHTEEELRDVFREFGDIETLFIVKDNQTKESRGIAFVKYKLTSAAALAQEKVGKAKIGDDPKPISVCIAASKNQQKSYDVNELSSRNRLYVILPDGAGEKDLQEQFSHFDGYESSHMVRNRSAGFVTFSRPSLAALAMENCEQSYHAVIAEPRDGRVGRQPLGQSGTGRLHDAGRVGGVKPPLPAGVGGISRAPLLGNAQLPSAPLVRGSLLGEGGGSASMATCVYVKFDRSVAQEQISRLCDTPPGMVACQLMHQHSDGQDQRFATVAVTYQTPDAAHYAKEKLGQIEYPPRSPLLVSLVPERAAGIAAAGFGADVPRPLLSMDGVNTVPYGFGQHSAGYVPLLPQQQQHQYHHQQQQVGGAGGVEQHTGAGGGTRAFFVCTPSPPAVSRLRVAFSCYGGLEKLWLVGDHNYGYAEFTNPAITQLVINQLNGSAIGGCKLKVVKANPRRASEESPTKKSQ